MVRMIAIGVGCRRGCASEAIVALVRRALQGCEDIEGPRRLFSLAEKSDEPGLLEAARVLGYELTFLPREALAAVASRVATHSAAAQDRFGLPSVAEAAALVGGGEGAELRTPRLAENGATCAVAYAPYDASEARNPWGSERPGVAKLPRNALATPRRLDGTNGLHSHGDDNATPTWLCASVSFATQRRLGSRFCTAKSTDSQRPEPRGAVKSRERKRTTREAGLDLTASTAQAVPTLVNESLQRFDIATYACRSRNPVRSRTLPHAPCSAGPHRPAVVKLLRNSSAALRRLRRDNAGPMRLYASVSFAAQRRLESRFRVTRIEGGRKLTLCETIDARKTPSMATTP